jgi:hypothetical protein
LLSLHEDMKMKKPYLERLRADVDQVHEQARVDLQKQALKGLAHRQQRIRVAAQYVQAAPQLAEQRARYAVQRCPGLEYIAQRRKVRGKA